MIRETIYSVDLVDIKEAQKFIPTTDRTTINRPVKSYFYDEWELKDEYTGTIWQKIYDSLPFLKGEARLITLDRGVNYYSHSDIDDRWHLNICGEQAYLIDLDNKVMHRVEEDGVWYDMDAGRLHVAANFGSIPRTQLVVRQLLTHHNLKDRVKLTITIDMNEGNIHYLSLDGTLNLTLLNLKNGGTYTIIVEKNANGFGTLTTTGFTQVGSFSASPISPQKLVFDVIGDNIYISSNNIV